MAPFQHKETSKKCEAASKQQGIGQQQENSTKTGQQSP